MSKPLLPLALLALAPSLALGQAGSIEAPACLDEFVLNKMEQGKIPGLAASIVRDGEVLWAKGYGLANLELGTPVTVDTPFFLASISKTVTGVALMQQRDLGALDLDDDINDYLGFPVVNPSHPGAPIRFRQVMTHTSSIRDNWPWMNPLYVPGDSPLELAFYLPGYLSPGGVFYDPVANYYTWLPGSTYQYANQGFALVGLLVETLAGQPFDEYCRQTIFEPLGMDDTGFRLTDFDPDTLAMPYEWSSSTEEYTALGHYGYPDYPAGTLRSSVLDLSEFLLAVVKDGTQGGVEILDAASMAEMKAVQFPSVNPDQGLAFYYNELFGHTTLGHDGGDPGVLTDMYYRPSDGVGVILLANSEHDFNAYYQIYATLWEYADSVAAEVPRLGTPPNPDAFQPGATSGPVIGETWDPAIDHTSFATDAVLDFVLLSGAAANVGLGAPGTLLCDPTSPLFFSITTSPGSAFALPIQESCDFIGFEIAAQGGSIDAGGDVHLANALDLTVGTY